MSRASQLAFLQKLHKELLRSGKTYRNNIANRREHTFKFSINSLVTQTKKELKVRKVAIDDKDIQALAQDMLVPLRQQADKLKRLNRPYRLVSNQYSIKVVLYTDINPKTDKGYDIFYRLRTLYREELDKYAIGLLNIAKESKQTINKVHVGTYGANRGKLIYTDTEITKGSDLFEGGHEKEAGVFETRIRDVVQATADEFIDDQLSASDLQANLDALGVDLTISRSDADDSHTISIESKTNNRLDGLSSAEKRKKLLDELYAAINMIGFIQDIKGSDSVSVVKRKKTSKKVMEPLKKVARRNKRIKVFEEDNKIKKSSKGASLSILPKVLKDRKDLSHKVKKPVSTSRASKSLTSAPLFMIAELNRQLPAVIENNMVLPGLQSVTGRFASSVRVTDIAMTAKGFPSIGYTYMKDPYQTFELGYKQGSTERDPRKLIERSIREIAAEFMVGRFYTRRI